MRCILIGSGGVTTIECIPINPVYGKNGYMLLRIVA
jgi:hypothetical protein